MNDSTTSTPPTDDWGTGCDCTERAPRARIVRNGARQIVEQCLRCGKASSQALPHSQFDGIDLLPFDESLHPRFEAEAAAARKRRKQAWFALHDEYLRSTEWRSKRAHVLERARGRCEGCGIRPPTQAHHQTYRHWRDEFLFELVAVCDCCHARLHADSANDYGFWSSRELTKP